MSDDESSVVSHEFRENELQEFNPSVSGVNLDMMRFRDIEELQNVRGEDLHKVLDERLNDLYFEGNVDSSFSEYKRVLDLLQSNRRWSSITLSDIGMARASPDFLSLVVLAQTRTTEICLSNCPMDRNFFACFHFGIQTLRVLSMSSGNIPISSEVATVLADNLASTTSLSELNILNGLRFESDGLAGSKLAEGIKRNNSLESLTIFESNLGTEATKSILRALSEGEPEKLSELSITLKAQSDCSGLVKKLMSSSKSKLETLMIGNHAPYRIGSRGGGTVNRQLKTFVLWKFYLDTSNLTSVLSALPMMPMLCNLSLHRCGISDLTPIIDYMRLPNCSVQALSLRDNNIGVDEAEKLVSCLGEMPSLNILRLTSNPWCNNKGEKERIKRIVQNVSKCWNLESFLHGSSIAAEAAVEYNLTLNLRTNRAWRRDLCYKKRSENLPSNLFPLVAARALRRIKRDMRSCPSLGPSVIFALLQERTCDLIVD